MKHRAAIRTLLQSCLRKDPRKRLRDIADARIDIEAGANPSATDPSAVVAPVVFLRRKRRIRALASVLALTVAAGTLIYLQSPRIVPSELAVFPIAPADGSRFTGTSPEFAISPDGRHIAFVASSTRESALWVRSVAALEPRPVAGTEGARNPFWSPDSQSIGYFADDKLKTVRVTGGSPVDVCPGPGTSGASAPSGTWNNSGVIVFGPSQGTLYKVDSNAGTATPVTTTTDGTVHRWPWFLPDGRHFLFLALRGEKGELRVGSLESPDSVTLAPAESHVTFAAGHLFFVRGGNLMAQPFDADARRPTADPLYLGAQAGVDPPWQRGMFSVSRTGRLVYRPTARARAQLTWLDRGGRSVGTVGDPGVFFNLDLSPDQQRVAISKLTERPGADATFDIWLMDVATGILSKLTDDPAWEFDPAWSPDGTQVAFNSNRPRPGPYGLFVRASNSSGKDVPLVERESGVNASSPDWSRKDVIVYASGDGLWTLRMTGDRKPTIFLSTQQARHGGVFSPDGRWIAYDSDATGRNEVYVRPFPAREGVFPISRDGGSHARWRDDGKELFFLAPDRTMMAARIDAARSFTASVPQPLFPSQLGSPGNRPYAVTRDGQRFLIPIEAHEPLRTVMDWRALLPR